MDTKQEIIRRYFRENDSIRKISRDIQINRKTIRKYLTEYLSAVQESDKDQDTEILQDYSSSPPIYSSKNREKKKLTQEIETVIKLQLEENEQKKRTGLGKQIKRKIDIHEYLLNQGFQIGYTTVCNYIRDIQLRHLEAYIKQVYLPGEECEFDWAEVKLYIAGILKRFYQAVFTSAYSNYRYSHLYTRQDTLAFMESHNDFFGKIGGVFHEMVYDNMRVAIAEFVGRNEKVPTEALMNLSGWYQFRWRFCNVRRGNEKGHVERSVEYVRRKAFSEKDHFDTFEEAQKHLEQVCERLNGQTWVRTQKSPHELLTEEKAILWVNPGIMSCYITHPLKVDKYSTLCFGTNHYSVPDTYCGRMVDVKVYSNKLKMYYNNQPIGEHERSYEMYQWQIKLEHYLKTLRIKPGALHGSLALQQAPEELKKVYQDYFTHQARGFVEILQYCQNKEHPWQKIIEVVDELKKLCPNDLSSEKVIAILGNRPIDPACHKNIPEGEIESYAYVQLQEITKIVNNIKN